MKTIVLTIASLFSPTPPPTMPHEAIHFIHENDSDSVKLLKYIVLNKTKEARPLINTKTANTTDKSGFTALHYTACTNNAEIAQQLLHHGADPKKHGSNAPDLLAYVLFSEATKVQQLIQNKFSSEEMVKALKIAAQLQQQNKQKS